MMQPKHLFAHQPLLVSLSLKAKMPKITSSYARESKMFSVQKIFTAESCHKALIPKLSIQVK